ncbi:hypothetical protein [Ideonella sp. YS5]|uniref:hypothetical protein n=1 Tax=Ideonella sp. YS5 TaxID=3453714 RepID=UPI003EE92274
MPTFAAGGLATLGLLLAGTVDWTLVLVAALAVCASYLIDAASERGEGECASARTRFLQSRRHRAMGFALTAVAAAWC